MLALELEFTSCREDSTRLHSGNLGEGDTKTATAVSEHRVVLSKRQNALLNLFDRDTHLLSHRLLTSEIMWYELMQRRIEQTDIDWATIHSFEDTLEVCLLIWEELSQCFLATFRGGCEDHFAHSDNLLIVEEHVLCTSQTDTFSAEVASNLCVVWGISIGANLHLGVFVAEIHEGLEVAREFSSLGVNLTCVNLTGRTIERNEITFVINNAFDFNSLLFVINVDSASARNAALTHTAGNHSSVRSHTTASGKDTFSS